MMTNLENFEMLLNYYKKWKELKPVSFIFITTILILAMMTPISIIIDTLDINDNEIGGINTDDYSFVSLLFLTVIIGPIIETFIAQKIPIKLSQKFSRKRIIPLLFSSIFFSILHIGYSFWYSLLIFPLGLLLAEIFIIFEERKESSFWVTTIIHSLKNLIAVISIFAA